MSKSKIENVKQPAFPRPFSERKNNGEQIWEQDGLTKREWFAGMAMQGMLANGLGMQVVSDDDKGTTIVIVDGEQIREVSYQLADAMLKEA